MKKNSFFQAPWAKVTSTVTGEEACRPSEFAPVPTEPWRDEQDLCWESRFPESLAN